jgi:hypothetical protein
MGMRIISGGQAGVDAAALSCGLELGYDIGGSYVVDSAFDAVRPASPRTDSSRAARALGVRILGRFVQECEI